MNSFKDFLMQIFPICSFDLESFNCHIRRRQWHPTPVLLPGKSHGRRSLVGCSPWGCKESDTTERLPFPFSLSCTGEGNGDPLQRSCLENPRDGGAWWAAVCGVAQSRTRLKWLSSSSSCHIWLRGSWQTGKLLERWEYQTLLPVSWETCMQVKKQQLEPYMEHLIGSRSRKEYDRAVCCHPVCLTYMLSTSWEMLGWISYETKSR